MEVWGGYGARGGGHGALSEVDMPSITFKRLFMVEVIFERLTLACCSYRCAHINPPIWHINRRLITYRNDVVLIYWANNEVLVRYSLL